MSGRTLVPGDLVQHEDGRIGIYCDYARELAGHVITGDSEPVPVDGWRKVCDGRLREGQRLAVITNEMAELLPKAMDRGQCDSSLEMWQHGHRFAVEFVALNPETGEQP